MWCGSCEDCACDQVVVAEAKPGIWNLEDPDNSDTEVASEIARVPANGNHLPACVKPQDPLVLPVLSKECCRAEHYVKTFKVRLQQNGVSTDSLDSSFSGDGNALRGLAMTLGMLLDSSTGVTILVCEVSGGGAAGVYNKKAPPELQLRDGDFIEEVNGLCGNMTIMMQEMYRNWNLTLLVSRAVEFEIRVRKKDTLGCHVTYDFNVGSALGVARVLEGPIQVWNDGNPLQKVLVGDRIVAVNGVKGATSDLLEMIRRYEELDLTIARPASSTAE